MATCVHSLTDRVYTLWGQHYHSFEWDNIWAMLIGMARKERQQIHPYEHIRNPFHNPKQCYTNQLICWFDRNILKQINPWDMNNEQTLRVRLRIVQGMADQNKHIPESLKPRVKDALVNTFNQFWNGAWDFRLKYIDQLPF